jgi:hypothetical protein
MLGKGGILFDLPLSLLSFTMELALQAVELLVAVNNQVQLADQNKEKLIKLCKRMSRIKQPLADFAKNGQRDANKLSILGDLIAFLRRVLEFAEKMARTGWIMAILDAGKYLDRVAEFNDEFNYLVADLQTVLSLARSSRLARGGGEGHARRHGRDDPGAGRQGGAG